ncbi:MAG: hypothetical protein HY000_04635 [Planctomycetes bacterium]|nr:hypothetical protein [Planctomycetota bacterium]
MPPQAGPLARVQFCSLAALILLCITGVVYATEPGPAQLRALGIRRVNGALLTLYTDVPPSAAVDDLPRVFDLAIPEWRRYFQSGDAVPADWRITGCLMQDQERFRRAGLLPNDLPEFANGYSRGRAFWFFEQPSDYYRRHLMLHEGTHLFMETAFRRGGPPWHFEGMAELLATHRYEEGKLTLNYFPQHRDETPMWGRIRAIRDAVADGHGLSLDAILAFDNRAHARVEAYAWCWGAAAFLDGHPRYRERFRQLADQGWQNSGLQLAPGQKYRLSASGRYQVADQPRIWWSEPGGVSIRYYHGRPLGMLLAAVRPEPAPDAQASNGFLHPVAVGLGSELLSPEGGTLYFRINDSAAELDDNAGELVVEVAGR